MKNEQQSEDFLAVNPHGRVPALVTDQGTITENVAIVNYLADTSAVKARYRLATPSPAPVPTSCSAGSRRACISPSPRCSGPTASARSTTRIRRSTTAAARRSAATSTSSTICAAQASWSARSLPPRDSYAAVFYRWAKLKQFDMSVYPRWTALVSRVVERPAVVRALEKEGLKPTQFA
jgi:glutathione S-transferase